MVMRITKAPFGKYCIATVPLGGGNFDKLTSLPGYKKWIGRSLMFDPTGANIERINKYWPDAIWDDEVLYILDDYINNLKEAEEVLRMKKEDLPENDDFNFETKPFEHQRKAFYMSRDKKSFALLMEQGTGKTKVIIDNAAYLYGKGEITALIVIAPNGVHRNWINSEIPIHMPKWCLHKSVFYTAGMNKKRTEEYNSVIGASDCLKIFSFNVEAFTSIKAIEFMQKALLSNKVMLVVDESSRIKRPGAKRTKIITKFGKQAEYLRIMTGTPVTKGPEDVYSQFKFLDHKISGRSKQSFFRTLIISYQNIDELTRNIEGHSFRVLKKDCLDLPDKIYQRHYVEMSAKQIKIYKNMKESFVAELEGQVVNAPEAITRLLRLQQITCGWFPTENGVEPIENKNLRLEALKEILGDINSKVIIWARFKADLKAIEAALGDLAVSYHGEVSNDDREAAVYRFQNDDSIRYFIGQPQSGGIGLTLTAADYVVYYSNSFDLEIRMQSEDRCHRIGTKNNVTYIDIEARKTIDSKIIKALREKKSLADIITKDPMSLFLLEEKK